MKKIIRTGLIPMVFTGFIALLNFQNTDAQENLVVSSPDQNIRVQVILKNKIYYSVFFRNEMIIAPSAISMNINDGTILGQDPQLKEMEIKEEGT